MLIRYNINWEYIQHTIHFFVVKDIMEEMFAEPAELVNQNGWLLSAFELILMVAMWGRANCIQLAGKCLLIFPVIMFNKPSTKRTWGTK